MHHGTFRKLPLLLGLVLLAVVAGGCKKKVAATAPAPPPAPALQPTVTLNASPSTVNAGDTVTLSWSSTNATDLDIEPGVGKVAPQGSTPVNPTQSTTFTITATGSGGSASASARVTVNASRASAPTQPAPGPANV